MSTYPILNNEPELLKIKTRDDEIKNIKYQKENNDHENILKSLKIGNEDLKKVQKFEKKEIIVNCNRNILRIGISYNYFHNVINQPKH